MRCFPLLLVLLAACALENAAKLDAPASTDAVAPVDDDSGGADDTGGQQTSSPAPPPRFWSVQGVLAQSGGVVDLATSVIGVRTWSDEADALCSYAVPLLSVIDADLDDTEVATVAWWAWSLDVGVSEDTGCSDWPARELEIGFGPLDARLDPALDARGWLGADLYGLYLRDDPSSLLFVIGAAGTADQVAGTESAATVAPLPDGVYELHTLILLDLP